MMFTGPPSEASLTNERGMLFAIRLGDGATVRHARGSRHTCTSAYAKIDVRSRACTRRGTQLVAVPNHGV